MTQIKIAVLITLAYIFAVAVTEILGVANIPTYSILSYSYGAAMQSTVSDGDGSVKKGTPEES